MLSHSVFRDGGAPHNGTELSRAADRRRRLERVVGPLIADDVPVLSRNLR